MPETTTVTAATCPPWCTRAADHSTSGRDLDQNPICHTGPDMGPINITLWEDGDGADRDACFTIDADLFGHNRAEDSVGELELLAVQAQRAADWFRTHATHTRIGILDRARMSLHSLWNRRALSRTVDHLRASERDAWKAVEVTRRSKLETLTLLSRTRAALSSALVDKTEAQLTEARLQTAERALAKVRAADGS